MKAILAQPVGSPIPLTRKEAEEVLLDSFGAMPDLPPGDEYVRHVRPIWAGLSRDADG